MTRSFIGQRMARRQNIYRDKREKNREAVRRSREKAKTREQLVAQKVHDLKQEKDAQEAKNKTLSHQLEYLKHLVKESLVKNERQQVHVATQTEPEGCQQVSEVGGSSAATTNDEQLTADWLIEEKLKDMMNNADRILSNAFKM